MKFVIILVGLIWIFSIFCFFGNAIKFSFFDVSPDMFSLMFGFKINDSYSWKQFGVLTFLFWLEIIIMIFGIYLVYEGFKDDDINKALKVAGFPTLLSFIAMIISFCTGIITETDYTSDLGSGAISYGVLQIVSIVIYLGAVFSAMGNNGQYYNANYMHNSIYKAGLYNDAIPSSLKTDTKKDTSSEINNMMTNVINDTKVGNDVSNDNIIKEADANNSNKTVSSNNTTDNIKKEKITNISTIKSNLSHSHKEYKVLSQKDQWFNGKFDPYVLESALNSYAKQGWRVVSTFSADIIGFIGPAREEAIIILERDADK